MKALLVVVMLCGIASAKKIVIMEPVIAVACPKAATWPLVLDCFKQHGLSVTPLATLDDSRLVAVSGDDKPLELEGFALYVHVGSGPERGTWRLGGLLQESGNVADFALLRIEHLPKGGYRFDMASSLVSSASVDGVTWLPAIYRQVTASFCSGDSYRCTQLIPRCEQLVHGQAITAFDGTITVRDKTLSLKGAGSVPACSASSDYTF